MDAERSEHRIVGGRYRLVRLIGSGGMGEVWLARHLELDTNVAVKLMAPELLAGGGRARFRREARALARLRSPHIVVVHDFGEDTGVPYMVMEHLSGEMLSERLSRSGPVTLVCAAAWLDQACEALAVAHAAGIVHRDVKPSNLFLTGSDADPQLKLLDFGIARVLTDDTTGSTTSPGTIVGSPEFMSPEQTNGTDVGPESDLWSLAAVAYWLLTGRKPFAGATVTETLARVRESKFLPPSALGFDVAVDEFFRKAFSVDPRERYRSAHQLSQAFWLLARARHASAEPRDAETRNLTMPRRPTRRFRTLLTVAALSTFMLWFTTMRCSAGPTRVAALPSLAAASSPRSSLRPAEVIANATIPPPRGAAPRAPQLAPVPPARSSARTTATLPSAKQRSPRASLSATASSHTHPAARGPDARLNAPGADPLPPGEATDPIFGLPMRADSERAEF